MKNPMQPLYSDERGVTRFKENKIVQYLLDNGGIDMNHLARKNFSEDDAAQFAQLIGYSLSGFSDLPYVSDELYSAANTMFNEGKSELEGKIEYLEQTLEMLRESLCQPMSELFGIHPDDLKRY